MDSRDDNSQKRRPLSTREFDVLMDQAAPAFPWALGVSGGSDSMALMVLCAHWAQRRGGPPPFILTVDHGLRAAAAEEAQAVGAWAADHGLAHHVLRWVGEKPKAGVQAAARAARYGLMARWCRRHHVRTLVTAHTQDDQAETLLLRLGRGSGVDGLAAMPVKGPVPLDDPVYRGLMLLRPLLPVRRARLRATLTALGQEWIDDPSNDDIRYARVRVRKTMALLGGDGLKTGRLAETARRMARARRALESAAAALGDKSVTFDNAGFARLDGRGLAGAPEELALRVLASALMAVAGSVYPPRLASLESLYAWLVQSLEANGRPGRGRTLAGCRIVPDVAFGRQGAFLVVREMRALVAHMTRHAVLPGDAPVLWDNRFVIDLPRGLCALSEQGRAEIQPLGREGWQQIRRTLKPGQIKPRAQGGMPAPVRPTLPALWMDGAVAAAPHFNHVRPELFPASMSPVTMAATFIRGSFDRKA